MVWFGGRRDRLDPAQFGLEPRGALGLQQIPGVTRQGPEPRGVHRQRPDVPAQVHGLHQDHQRQEQQTRAPQGGQRLALFER